MSGRDVYNGRNQTAAVIREYYETGERYSLSTNMTTNEKPKQPNHTLLMRINGVNAVVWSINSIITQANGHPAYYQTIFAVAFAFAWGGYYGTAHPRDKEA